MNAYPVAWINGLDVRTTVDDRGFEGVETVRVDVPRPQGVGAAQVRVGELVLLDTRLVRVEGDDAGAVVCHHRHARLSRRLEPCPQRLVLRPTAVGVTAGGLHSAEPARAEKQRAGGSYDAVSSILTPTMCSGYLRMASTAGSTLIWLTWA